MTYGDWICEVCGKKYGKREPLMATWHYGLCDWCEREAEIGAADVESKAEKYLPVTEPRDFGYPDMPERDDELA